MDKMLQVDVPIGSKCHSGRSELGCNVQAACILLSKVEIYIKLGPAAGVLFPEVGVPLISSANR